MGNDFIRPSFFAFLPIQQCNLPDSGTVIAKAEEDANRIKAKGIPGLAEQVDIWLEMLRNEKEPDFEYTMNLLDLASGVLHFGRSDLFDRQTIDRFRLKQTRQRLTPLSSAVQPILSLGGALCVLHILYISILTPSKCIARSKHRS